MCYSRVQHCFSFVNIVSVYFICLCPFERFSYSPFSPFEQHKANSIPAISSHRSAIEMNEWEYICRICRQKFCCQSDMWHVTLVRIDISNSLLFSTVFVSLLCAARPPLLIYNTNANFDIILTIFPFRHWKFVVEEKKNTIQNATQFYIMIKINLNKNPKWILQKCYLAMDFHPHSIPIYTQFGYFHFCYINLLRRWSLRFERSIIFNTGCVRSFFTVFISFFIFWLDSQFIERWHCIVCLLNFYLITALKIPELISNMLRSMFIAWITRNFIKTNRM